MKKTSRVLAVTLIAGTLMVAGCSSAQRDLLVDEIEAKQAEVADLDSEIAEIQAALQTTTDSEVIDQLLAGIALYQSRKAQIDSELITLKEALTGLDLAEGETVGNAFLIGSEGAKSVAGFLPPPWREIVFGGAALLGAAGTGMNRRRAKKAEHATSEVVKAIEVAKTASPAAPEGVVDFADPVTKAKMKLVMDNETREVVNKIRGK
jgi:outer membrane murein-binding lipoprotein Lpp